MKIVVFALDFPYPARGGGRADVWRRVEAFLALGHEVMLVHLDDPRSSHARTPDVLAHVDGLVAARCSFTIKRSRLRTVRQLANMVRVPWHMATRVPDPDEKSAIVRAVREFAPDLLWLDGPWFGELAQELHDDLGTPIAYRSHNVEHLYLRRQAGAAKHVRQRVAWRLASVGLKRYQLRLMHTARWVFDISLADMETWKGLGVSNISWLPPLPELALVERPSERVPMDVVFVGGMRLPNNIQGVRWLVGSVLPRLLDERPDIVVGLVGLHPFPDLAAELEGVGGVRTFYDVDDVRPYHFGARVLVNPVAVGSGVQLKMVDMLMTDAPIVTRTQGLSGLPSSSVGQFDVADTPEEFAACILRRLESPDVDLEDRVRVRRQFDVHAVESALARVSSH